MHYHTQDSRHSQQPSLELWLEWEGSGHTLIISQEFSPRCEGDWVKAFLSPEEPGGDKGYLPSCSWEPAHLGPVLLLCGSWGSAGRCWVGLPVPGSGSSAPSPSTGFGISHPQGLRACSNFKSIDQSSEGITCYCCHILPKILEQGGSESFAESLCWADTASQHREKGPLARASRQIWHVSGSVGIILALLL